ncbi:MULTISPECIES: tetratricopeptide repeat protein [unclassified Fibrobacter]|uniref:tetratricopeptide repeat protein n=1 Tax=unclassified Fibrobacter TaxID=2634177 RepID=UPI000D6CC379|nr:MULTISPECIES: tetratricopeptide repeat protein [unclassified Fibrobacter]PWJ64453.1 tetratricopeptide repeat protein [Fibrobacter sp. UWR4]PZW69330.1 tetratricopeptide repeat protein [Fibrobacter sp. UWR1]
MNKKFCLFAVACLFAASQAMAEDPRIAQGRVFESQGNFEMALGEYRAMLAEDSRNSEAYLAAANVRVKMKDYSGALANYRLAYKFNPKMSAAYEGAAKVYELLGDKKRAEAERAKDPKNKPAEEEVVAAVETPAAEPAPKAVEAPKPVETVAETPKAAEAPKPAETPKVAEPAPAPKAVETPKVAEAPKAEPAKTVDALPTDPFEKGKALFAAGKYNEAAPMWREVLKKTPGHAGAYFYAGLTRFELGEYDKAEFNLKKGLEYKEEGNDANYYLACVYQKSNKTELEKRFLNNYLKKAAPNAKFRRKAESRLAEMEMAKAEAAKAAEEKKLAEAATAAEPQKTTAEPEAVKPVKNAPAAAAAAPVAATVTDAEGNELSIAAAVAKFREGNLSEALQSYKTLLETQQNPEERYFTLLQMGNIYREMRDFHSAVTRYREVVQQFPDSDWATEAERALEDAVWLEKHASELPRRR